MLIKITPSDKQLLPSHLWYVWHTHAKFQYIPLPARDVHHARRDACVVTNDVGRPTSPRHVEQQGHSLPGAMLAQAPLRQNTQPTLSKYLWEVMGCKFRISTISLIHNHRDSKSRVSALISIAKTTHSAFALFGSGKSHHTQNCSFFFVLRLNFSWLMYSRKYAVRLLVGRSGKTPGFNGTFLAPIPACHASTGQHLHRHWWQHPGTRCWRAGVWNA